MAHMNSGKKTQTNYINIEMTLLDMPVWLSSTAYLLTTSHTNMENTKAFVAMSLPEREVLDKTDIL